jgi:CheY-like chemotaxis protein
MMDINKNYGQKCGGKKKIEKNLSILPKLSKGETILLVEDEEQVRKLASRLLTNKGYIVIEAKSAIEAIQLFQERKKKIDLLLTDMIMPDMNGKQLSEELLKQSPNLKILFMSGYNEDMGNKIEDLNSSAPLLLKPFTSRDLSKKIRKILDRPERQSIH